MALASASPFAYFIGLLNFQCRWMNLTHHWLYIYILCMWQWTLFLFIAGWSMYQMVYAHELKILTKFLDPVVTHSLKSLHLLLTFTSTSFWNPCICYQLLLLQECWYLVGLFDPSFGEWVVQASPWNWVGRQRWWVCPERAEIEMLPTSELLLDKYDDDRTQPSIKEEKT